MRFLLLIFFMISISLANDYADWETITDMNEVHDIAFDENLAWVATSGGIYSYNLSDSQITRYTNLDGLSSINNNTLEIDDHGYIIAGGSDGILEFYSKETKKWSQLTVLIENSISDILYINDTLWVAAGKGIAVIPWNGSEYVFKDFYKNFDIIPNRVTKIAYFMKKIWLGTDKGLLSAPTDINKYTLNDPDNWNYYSMQNNQPYDVLDIEEIDNSLWVGRRKGLINIDQKFNFTILDKWGDNPAGNIIKFNKRILISDIQNRLFEYDFQQGRVFQRTFRSNIKCMEKDLNGKLYIGLENEGIYQNKLDKYIILDGPSDNDIRVVIKDSKSNIWVSTGKFRYYTGKGFFIFDGNGWKHFDFSGTGWNQMGNTDYISEDNYGNIWICTWGGGLIAMHDDEFSYFHNFNTPGKLLLWELDEYNQINIDPIDDIYRNFFTGHDADINYEVITYTKMDMFGRLWIANYIAANDNFIGIAPYTNEGFISLNKNDWIYINQSVFPGIGDGEISCIGFDDFYQAYIGTFRNGLYIIDYQNPGSVNYVKKLTTKDNLYDNNIITVKKDQDGIIWIGTASGLNSYDGINLYRHPGDVNGLSGPLGNQINQIFVDEANNKWFATSGGLSILRGGRSPWDSTAWIGFTKENSGLVGNMVNTVFVDPDNSEALIGTESGLSIYRGDFAEIRQEYDKMAAGPNPFIIGKATNKFIIKNLIYNSEVKIFTLNGQLVRVLNANTGNVDGGRAEWDGRDSNGKLVSSGVYLFFSYSENGKSKAGKVAVIRD